MSSKDRPNPAPASSMAPISSSIMAVVSRRPANPGCPRRPAAGAARRPVAAVEQELTVEPPTDVTAAREDHDCCAWKARRDHGSGQFRSHGGRGITVVSPPPPGRAWKTTPGWLCAAPPLRPAPRHPTAFPGASPPGPTPSTRPRPRPDSGSQVNKRTDARGPAKAVCRAASASSSASRCAAKRARTSASGQPLASAVSKHAASSPHTRPSRPERTLEGACGVAAMGRCPVVRPVRAWIAAATEDPRRAAARAAARIGKDSAPRAGPANLWVPSRPAMRASPWTASCAASPP